MNHHTSRLRPDGTTFPPVTPDPPPPPGYVDPLERLEGALERDPGGTGAGGTGAGDDEVSQARRRGRDPDDGSGT
ncbi:hypothetical protein [Knoellia aerolata]|uniref:Uncharacterized protein n=1 Tax=Knoellia aerolata DSM 18566 TaxID=1385519 RepID=A0A0A0K026_9MICO|nr:hypothetical protein [Knoellia aerolata]KGN41687.1 hypothetical protein N801_06605 [Knoellia aerolata DSM 18566]